MSVLSELTPDFCVIAPVAYLPQFCKNKRHLVLAHLVDTCNEYANYYWELQHGTDDNHYIIMDNGAFELGESYKPNELVRLATKCGANAVVLPDYPFRPAQVTIDAAEDMVDNVHAAGFDTFYCPQSTTGDWGDWVRGYEWGARHDQIDIIGMSILAIPNALPHIPAAYARVVATALLQESGVFDSDKYHHYLGSNAGMALEVPPLLKMGALDSVDSSNPVWHAILGHEYSKNTDSYLPVKKVSMSVQFDYPLTTDSETLRRIQHNVDLTFNLFDDRKV